MSPHKSAEHISRWVDRSFGFVESTIYMALGALLAIAAMTLMVVSAVDFFSAIAIGELGELDAHIVNLLGRLLLVLLIAELLYTVKVSFATRSIVVEPFLFIGLIAAIRRVFVLTAEFSDASGAGTAIAFQRFVIELGALSVLILVIALSLLLLRKSTTYQSWKKRSVRSDSNDIDSADGV